MSEIPVEYTAPPIWSYDTDEADSKLQRPKIEADATDIAELIDKIAAAGHKSEVDRMAAQASARNARKAQHQYKQSGDKLRGLLDEMLCLVALTHVEEGSTPSNDNELNPEDSRGLRNDLALTENRLRLARIELDKQFEINADLMRRLGENQND